VRTPEALIGESPERLTLPECERYAGWWMALELYTPETLPLRLVEALGRSSTDCIAQLNKRGLAPANFEYVQLRS
jgi:hypothetical protein